ncbi:vacuolar-sorting protein SNF7 [Russula ochroleuca]|jgi:charged multivesicular body protein 4|uniref:Vacuolar-sorting protein SNF7 n=1 Tax=Russula ochroleuca TaxID=152965 RepID=A0A9P5TCV5_9AGAM|nr:vacuolar-sorting protein SNF7 [Russula ochroleuca]
MMASFMSYFTGRRDPKQTARDAIVSLREQLMMIEKKEEHLQRQIAQDLATAKANAVSNKSAATAALRRKKMHEADLDKLAGMRLQLEVQVNTLESANINANTLDVMRRGASALKDIHNGITLDKVDATMSAVNEQRDIANEISETISSTANIGLEFDEEELKAELGELEQEDLNERLLGADHVPVHTPAGPSRVEVRHPTAEEHEDAELKALQASLAMS